MDLQSLSFAHYDAARIVALVVFPTLSAYATVILAVQVHQAAGLRRLLWLLCGAVPVTLGMLCTLELAAGSGAGAFSVEAVPRLLQVSSVYLCSIWILQMLSPQRSSVSGTVASSVAMALLIIGPRDVEAILHHHTSRPTYEVLMLSVLVASASFWLYLKAAEVAKIQSEGLSLKRVALTLLMGVMTSGYFVFILHADPANELGGQKDLLAGALPLTVLCLGSLIVLIIALVSATLSRLAYQRAKILQTNDDQQRMREALADQRVTRLQNEALLQEIQERQKAEGKLRFAAFHDSATGLQNRAYVSMKLTEMLQARDPKRPAQLAVISVNIDGFKAVNELVGRPTGDLVLVEISKRLLRFSIDDAILARIGGDEFLLLLKHPHSLEQAQRKAHLMLSAIEEPIALAGVVVNVSASLGLCDVGAGYKNAENVLRDVDTALQTAKHEGGGRCVLFTYSMHEEALAALQRKLELKAAVENEEFVLYYQPFVDMRDRSIYGMEALIRWNHPTKGLVPPGAFITLAEETGQILNIGLWVLKQACKEFASLQEHSKKRLLLSLNVSPRQLFETPFLQILKDVLEETEIPPSSLQLELTESILIKDAASIGSLLHDIRALGVKIAFDDFGTGYSSLSYLVRYPIDTLKVDQSFVRGMNQSAGGANLVLFMVALATEFNMTVTAEGVEELEHEKALLKQGCMFAQGYLYSRPLPINGFIALLQTGLKMDRDRTLKAVS